MLQFQATPSVVQPPPPLNGGWAEKRAHPRIPSTKLGITRVAIRNRPSAALVDLSSGGALLELPFQLPPESRVEMQLDTAGKKLDVPFQLLRCYVARLSGGVKYHAAGAFDNPLNLESLTMRASSALQRLMTSLERLERGVQKTARQSRSDAQFHETLTDLIAWLREGESLDLMVLKLKANLTRHYRSLLIFPASTTMFDLATSMECFGLTFKAKHPLTAHDRRFLKANAQLISILEETRRELRDEDLRPGSPQVLRSAADWIVSQSDEQPKQVKAKRSKFAQPVNAPRLKLPNAASDEGDYFSALKLDPAFA